jgi:hypothetical protein
VVDALERVHLDAGGAVRGLGFARLDTHRAVRRAGRAGTGKTPAPIAAIADRIVARGESLLVTRAPSRRNRRAGQNAAASYSGSAHAHLRQQNVEPDGERC